MGPNHRCLRGLLAVVAVTGLLTGAAAARVVAGGAVAARVVADGTVLDGASAPPLTQTTLTSVGSDGAAAAEPNARAAIAENGGYVAFQSQAALKVSASVPGATPTTAPNWRVYARDDTTQTTSLLSDPGAGNATAPAISASGKLVGYLLDGGGGNNVTVVNRQATGTGAFDTQANLAVRQVTGTPNDLQFERIPGCPTGFSTAGATRTTPCGPELSADGSTLVYPAQLSPVSPALSTQITPADSETASPQAPTGNVIDFGLSAQNYSVSEDLDIAVHGNQPVTFSSPTLTFSSPSETAPFSVGADGCVGTIAPGGRCSVTLNFTGNGCAQANSMVTGTFQTNANVPAGQSRVALVDYCDLEDDAYVRPSPDAAPRHPAIVLLAQRQAAQRQAAQSACPAAPAGLHLVKAPAAEQDDAPSAAQPLIDTGPAVIGQPYVTWTTYTAPSVEGSPSTTFQFTAPDCGIQLVSDPASLGLADQLPAGQPAPCSQGESLAAAASCTAYLLVTPSAVGTDVAGLIGQESGFAAPAVEYFAVTGVSDIIVARHDKAGAGNFAASPSTVVSVDAQGNVIPDASQPSVSSTGRYVAFTAPVPAGQAGEQVDGRTTVWRHDTDAAGNGSYHPGATTTVSCLPGGNPGSCPAAADADSPSLSGDGTLVAFAAENQVYARDIAAGTSALISVPAANTTSGTANGDSYAPALSQDGSTVAYISTATDLTSQPTPGGAANLYLRDLGTGATAGNELVSPTGASLPAADDIALPDLTVHGGLVSFQTSQQLLPAAPKGTESIYTFERLPRLGFSPVQVSFGTVKAHSPVLSQLVTVTNTGPGPGTVTGDGTSAPFTMSGDSCVGALLRPGSTCTFTASLNPLQEGQDTANLTETATDDGGTSLSFTAPITATVQPVLTLTPGVAPPGQVTEVTGIGFIPGQQVTLSWVPGLGQTSVVPNGSGGFTVAMVVFPDDFTGLRVLDAADPSGKVVATVNFLVQQPSVQPPFTTTGPAGGSG